MNAQPAVLPDPLDEPGGLSHGEPERVPLAWMGDWLRCRRLPWWRQQEGVLGGDRHPAGEVLPPRPPGWSGPGLARAGVRLEGADGLWARVEWVVTDSVGVHLVVLGLPSSRTRRWAQLLGAFWMRERGGCPRLWCQAPPVRRGGPWGILTPLPAPRPVPGRFEARVIRLLEDLARPLPPPASTPRGWCGDCRFVQRCGDRDLQACPSVLRDAGGRSWGRGGYDESWACGGDGERLSVRVDP